MSNQILEARDAVFLELMDIAKQDRDVILLTVDTGAFLFKEFKKSLPHQFFNVGIAEQNAASVCAGLALAGKKPFLFGISNFVVLRCFEQIKIDICTMNLPVTIIGMGTGYVYPKDGPTHHMTDVLSLARTLPGMTIWSPSDYMAISAATRQAYTLGGPNLIYMDKGPFPPLSDESTDFALGVRVVRQGSDITLVSTGIMTPQAILASEALAQEGIKARVVDVYRLKPLDIDRLVDAIGPVQRILTLEENVISGGLGSILCEIVAEGRINACVKRLGIADAFRCEIGTREDLRTMDGIDVESVARAAQNLLAQNL